MKQFEFTFDDESANDTSGSVASDFRRACSIRRMMQAPTLALSQGLSFAICGLVYGFQVSRFAKVAFTHALTSRFGGRVMAPREN